MIILHLQNRPGWIHKTPELTLSLFKTHKEVISWVGILQGHTFIHRKCGSSWYFNHCYGYINAIIWYYMHSRDVAHLGAAAGPFRGTVAWCLPKLPACSRGIHQRQDEVMVFITIIRTILRIFTYCILSSNWFDHSLSLISIDSFNHCSRTDKDSYITFWPPLFWQTIIELARYTACVPGRYGRECEHLCNCKEVEDPRLMGRFFTLRIQRVNPEGHHGSSACACEFFPAFLDQYKKIGLASLLIAISFCCDLLGVYVYIYTRYLEAAGIARNVMTVHQGQVNVAAWLVRRHGVFVNWKTVSAPFWCFFVHVLTV